MTTQQAQHISPGDHFKIFPALDAMDSVSSIDQEQLDLARKFFTVMSASGVFTVAQTRPGDGVTYLTSDTGEEWALPSDIPLILVEDLDSL